MSRRRGECKRCGLPGRLTRHHIYPKRFFKGQKGSHKTVPLCVECHKEIETLYPQHKPMSMEFYWETCNNFLNSLPIDYPVRAGLVSVKNQPIPVLQLGLQTA